MSSGERTIYLTTAAAFVLLFLCIVAYGCNVLYKFKKYNVKMNIGIIEVIRYIMQYSSKHNPNLKNSSDADNYKSTKKRVTNRYLESYETAHAMLNLILIHSSLQLIVSAVVFFININVQVDTFTLNFELELFSLEIGITRFSLHH